MPKSQRKTNVPVANQEVLAVNIIIQRLFIIHHKSKAMNRINAQKDPTCCGSNNECCVLTDAGCC
jgi:hypothetical protein